MSAENANKHFEVLLIDSDAPARKAMKSYLTAQGVTVTATADNLPSALHLVRALRHGILVLELPANPAQTLEAVRRIRASQPQIGIILTASELTPELILRSMRAGAQEFLPRPLDIRELGEAINRLRSMQAPAAGMNRPGGKIVSVFACKGGAGVSSIAANLALALQKRDAKVALVDLDLQMGDLALMLDLRPTHSLAEILRGTLDEAKLRSILVPHASGLSVLASPERIDDSDAITPAQVSELLGLLQYMFDWVIVDAGRTFDARPLEALSAADLVLMATTPTVPATRNTKLGIAMLNEMGLTKDRMRLILNRHHKGSGVKPHDLEETVGMDIFCRLPADPRTMDAAINAGTPAFLHSPRAELSRAFTTLADELSQMNLTPADSHDNEAAA